jgi:uncharacterized DUF497 family protein
MARICQDEALLDEVPAEWTRPESMSRGGCFRKDRIVTGEQRWHAIGAAEAAVLLVVHISRSENENGEEETIRIISAREANKRERRIYIQQGVE